jgi:hypothetical protein
MSGHVPDQVLTRSEACQSPRIEHQVGCAVHNVHTLGASGAIEIRGIERKLVRQAIGEIQIEIERTGRIPRGCYTVVTGWLLKRARVAARSGPGIDERFIDRDLRIRRQ